MLESYLPRLEVDLPGVSLFTVLRVRRHGRGPNLHVVPLTLTLPLSMRLSISDLRNTICVLDQRFAAEHPCNFYPEEFYNSPLLHVCLWPDATPSHCARNMPQSYHSFLLFGYFTRQLYARNSEWGVGMCLDDTSPNCAHGNRQH